MIAQERLLPLSFSKKENSAGSSVPIDQFLREALQILNHADNSLCNNTVEDDVNSNEEREADNDTDDDNDSVTWQLNLTPTMMTLDTSILTVSGLEKVLELIRINVKPQPPKFKDKKRVNSDQFDISIFQQMIEPVLRLSTVMAIPRSEQLGQYNSMQLMRHCVQSFIDCGYSFFLDVPSLVANTEMILSQPGAAKEHTVETLLILSICTLMIRHTTIHHRGDMTVANALMHAYHAQARQLLQELFDVHHISVVQSMFILSLFPQGHIHLFSPSRVKSPLLTMAVRMALAMDLHKLDTQHDKESDQKEKLRRLAWMLLCADYYADWNSTGQTGLIDVSDWHVDFPQPLPNELSTRRVEFFSQYCRIVMIRKMELFKSAYMISLQSPKALKSGLDEQLFQTYFNTPDMFKLNLEDPNKTWSLKYDLEPLLLHELHCHTQIFAQLPFLPRRYFQDFLAEEDTSRCADLNDIYQRIIRLLSTTANDTPLPTRQFTTAITTRLNSTATTTATSLKQPFSTEQDLELEFYCLVGCLTILNNYTQILEALTSIDAIGCHHSPVYGAMLTIHLYFIIEKSCQYPEIRSVSQINLIRTQRILRQARTIYADPAILFLERMLARHNVMVKEDITICTLNRRTLEIIRSLQAKSSYLHHAYDDEDEDEEDNGGGA
jgi:hypothetical protein